jgi:hypothetical protein
MANTTMTSRDFFTAVINLDNVPENLKEYATSQIEKLDKRNESRQTNGTANQRKNKEIAESLYNVLADNTIYTAKQIVGLGVDGIISTQKATAIVGLLVKDGRVTVSDIKDEKKNKVKGYTKVTIEETAKTENVTE